MTYIVSSGALNSTHSLTQRPSPHKTLNVKEVEVAGCIEVD